MKRLRALAFLALFPLAAPAQDPKSTEPKKDEAKKPEKLPPIPGYKTVAELTKADPKQFKENAPTRAFTPGFFGVEVANGGKPTVGDVAPKSPAEVGGLKVGDVITKIGDEAVTSSAAVKERLRGLPADEKVALTLERDGKPMVLTVTPRPTSKPLTPTTVQPQLGTRALLGVRIGDIQKDGGVPVDTLTTGGAADKAGIKEKDVLLQIDGKKIDAANSLTELLAGKRPGDVVTVKFARDGKEQEAKATLQGDQPTGGPGGGRGFGQVGGWNDAIPSAWKRKDYKLAVIGIDYPDVKHNEKIGEKDWEASLFSVGKYTEKSATGQTVYGSMADYYKEISYGDLKVEGKFAGWVEVSKKRLEYSTGSGTSTREKSALLTEAVDKLLAKDKDALKDTDGVFFLFAGPPVTNVTRGSLYWPHRANFRHSNKSWPYFIVSELNRSEKMTDISVFCHEFGHMLGLPDLYARPEEPGMEGVGPWCAMSQQLPNGRPQHFSAWSKMQLGWVKPTMIDPRVKQKVVLSPIEDDPTQCVKVPLRTDGSEYLLLENRRKKGWDTELPAEGLLIWRVMPGNRPQPVYIEESHGIEGARGPNQSLGAVPFPSPSNDSFTPFTTPSSRAKRGGGMDVFVTNITRHPDGRVTFHIGYEYQ
ncbi:MAG: M6 family metalloprotease domain-containing protein [Fimbriiglobus sp.]|jgi:M6 family metalloprotease-like protein|nr:M6 family metalloprotease domain-containing protein [Fimbriiglobus sp.]